MLKHNVAYNYTTWGYQDCQYNPDDGSFGGMLTKLLFRHLPDHYPVGSAYAHFPFQVPGIMKTHAAKLRSNPVDKYSWSRPLKRKPVVVVRKHDEVQQVFGDIATFPSPHEDRLFNLTSGAVLDHDLVSVDTTNHLLGVHSTVARRSST
jgi:linoleate 10R-lipoxygenase